MESRVNALEDCFKETEKRLDAVDKKVDTAFQEAEVIKTEGEGESSQEERESELAPKISQTLKSFHAIKDEYKSLVNEIEELKTAQTAAMTEILGQLESATGDMDKLKHILGEDAAKTEKPE